MSAVRPEQYNRILRTISVLGSASVASVVLGVAKMKVAALLLGPAGIGLIGLLQNAVGVATTFGDMGMRQSGAREIAAALGRSNGARVKDLLLTLIWMGLVFGLLSSAIFFAARELVAERLLNQPHLSNDLGWATAAVAATIMTAALTAIINGHQRIAEITRLTIWSAAASCVVSIASLWLWRPGAIIVFVVSAPLALFIFSLWYVVRIGALPRLTRPSFRHVSLTGSLLRLGVFVMISALVLSAAELTVRSAIQYSLSLSELGLFSAAWSIGVYYLNFLMVATSTDFFPRLAKDFDDEHSRNEAINLQIQAMCFVAAPVIVGLSTFCPWLMHLMYSSEFLDAAWLVRLMVIGDVFRLIVYPLGFVFIAASSGRSYLGVKLLEGGAFAALTLLLLPRAGLTGVGIAHVVTFVTLFGVYYLILATQFRFRFTLRSIAAIAGLAASAISLGLAAIASETLAVTVGIVLLAVWTVVAVRAWGIRAVPAPR